MEFWEESMKGEGKLQVILSGETTEYPCAFKITQSITGQLNLFVEPMDTEEQKRFASISKNIDFAETSIWFEGETEEGMKVIKTKVFPYSLIKWSPCYGVVFEKDKINFHPPEIIINRKPLRNRTPEVRHMMSVDLVNASSLHNFPPFEFDTKEYNYQIMPYLDESSLEIYNSLTEFSVTPFPIVDTHLMFQRYPNSEELNDYIDSIITLYRIIFGSSIEVVRKTETVNTDILKIVFSNVLAERSGFYPPIIQDVEHFYSLMSDNVKHLCSMEDGKRRRLCLALHYTLKGRNELVVENRILNALTALEIFFSENCATSKHFDPRCLKRLLDALNIRYPPSEHIGSLGKIAGVRGEIVHKGIFPTNIVSCDAERFLRCILTVIDEILLRFISYSGTFYDTGRHMIRNVGK